MASSIDGVGSASSARPAVVEVRLPQSKGSESGAEARSQTEKAAVIERERVVEASHQVEQFFQSVRRNLRFQEDSVSGRVVVSVIDAETGEIVRQIPPEKVVRLAESLARYNGMLLGERA